MIGSTPVIELNLSYDAKVALLRANIKTIDQLYNLPRNTLCMRLKSNGTAQKTIDDIFTFLNGKEEEKARSVNSRSILNSFLKDYSVSTQTKRLLHSLGVETIEDLLSLSKEDMKKASQIGNRSFQEIMRLQTAIFQTSSEMNESVYVFQTILPEISIENANGLYFDVDGFAKSDIKLIELPFSKRLMNALKSAGYESIREVVLEPYEVIKKVRNLGLTSIEEMEKFLVQALRFDHSFALKSSLSNNIFDYYVEKWEAECPEFEPSSFETPIKLSIASLLSKRQNVPDNLEQFLDDGFLTVDIFADENVQVAVESKVKSVLKTNWVKKDVLYYSFPEEFVDFRILDNAINHMYGTGIIEVDDEKLRLVLPTLSDWICSLPDKERIILALRFEGGTLDECGKEVGVTRERARQLIKKALRKRPQLREDDYKYWFENYSLSLAEMEAIFQITPKVYYYYCDAYKKGALRVESLIDDRRLSYEEYKRTQKFLGKNKLHIGVFLVEPNREEIIKTLLKVQFHGKSTTIGELFEAYKRALKNNGIEDGKLYVSSERTFGARLPDYIFTLTTYGKKVRYYDFTHTDAENLVDNLHFKQFNNCEISTRKLFLDNNELMNDYNLQDEYELHNYLKKTEHIWGNKLPYVSLGRMPTVYIGRTNRKEQLEKLLFEVAPVTLDEFCLLYEKEYGVLAQTVQANYATYIEKYYHQGYLTVDQPPLSKEEDAYLDEILSGEFFYIENLYASFAERFGEKSIEKLTPRALKEHGFKVYSQYIISNNYSSAEDYFKHFLTKKPLLDFSTLDSRLVYLGSMNSTLDSLRQEHILLEYEKGKYLSFEHLHSVKPDITQSDLDDYIVQAIKYASEPFFSVQSLNNQGFTHRVQSIPLDEWFFSSLIKNSKKVRTIVVGGGQLHYLGNKPQITADMIRYEIKSFKSFEIESFILYVKDKYGLSIQKDKMIDNAKKANLYYDNIMEKIYFSKDDYYKDLDL